MFYGLDWEDNEYSTSKTEGFFYEKQEVESDFDNNSIDNISDILKFVEFFQKQIILKIKREP